MTLAVEDANSKLLLWSFSPLLTFKTFEESVDEGPVIADSSAVASQVRQQLDNSLSTFTYSFQYFCQN